MKLEELDVNNKRVLVRVDFNVPQDKEGHITDDSRIKAALPTIQYLIDKKAKVILMSHLGRPEGQKSPKYSLKPCAERLSLLLKQPVLMAPDCIGAEVKTLIDSMKGGEILLLENLRFHKEEEAPDGHFEKELASLGEVYINDAFGTAHRAHSSTSLIASYFTEKAPGFLMKKEIAFLHDALASPKRPFYALIGGSKVSSKLGVLQALLDKADALFIGGAMAYTFLKAQGLPVGESLVEDSLLGEAKKLLQSEKIYLPTDHIVTDGNEVKTVQGAIESPFKGVDIGPQTEEEWAALLKKAKTIFWNGPLGLFEDPRFAHGTKRIAHAITEGDAITVVGGGDSVSAIENEHLSDKITHLSTGGGAALEYIEKGMLPGINALK